MHKLTGLGSIGLGLAFLAGCSANGDVEPASTTVEARASIRNSAGRSVAVASAAEGGDRIRVRVDASGLLPGTYAVHIHAVGRCDGPAFESAGPHWNPTARQHGSRNPQGPHRGDLPNLSVGTNGAGSVEFVIPTVAVNRGPDRLLDPDGAAIVVHAGPDDYRTDPSGNSGARIACGVFA